MAGNPYKTQEFVSKIHVWLQDVDPVRLRGLVQQEGLISFDQLERLRKIKDIAEHNAELISILCPGGTKSYLVLCSVIHQMGYIDQYLEMLRIVASPEQGSTSASSERGHVTPISRPSSIRGITPLPRTVTYVKPRASPYDKTRRMSNEEKGQARVRTEESLFCLHSEDDRRAWQMDTVFKVAVLGDRGVGKSTFIRRVRIGKDGGDIEELKSTVGIECQFLEYVFNGKKIGLQIWDMSGEESFRTCLSSYMRPMDGVFLMYDCTHIGTFENLQNWHSVVQKICPSHVTVAVVANKIDLVEGSDQHCSKDVTDSEGQQIANTFGDGLFMATSGRSGMGVDEICSVLIQNMLLKEESMKRRSRNPTPMPAPVTRRKCCRSA